MDTSDGLVDTSDGDTPLPEQPVGWLTGTSKAKGSIPIACLKKPARAELAHAGRFDRCVWDRLHNASG